MSAPWRKLPVMRFILLAVPLLLAGCAAGPQALGITGPGAQPAAPATEAAPDPFDNPNAMQSGGRYGPSYAPTTGSGRYWGYD